MWGATGTQKAGTECRLGCGQGFPSLRGSRVRSEGETGNPQRKVWMGKETLAKSVLERGNTWAKTQTGKKNTIHSRSATFKLVGAQHGAKVGGEGGRLGD